MRTLQIAISELEYDKFALRTEQLSFSEFVDIVSLEIRRQSLAKAVSLAEQYGLSALTMDDISAEVRAVRDDAARP